MVLGQWLERGLGQILAPDENYKSCPEWRDTQYCFWNLVAPDPNFSADPETKGETTTNASPPSIDFSRLGRSAPGDAAPLLRTPLQSDTASNAGFGNSIGGDELKLRVLEASTATAESMNAQPLTRKKTDLVFGYCTSINPLRSKQLKKLGKCLKEEPELVIARSCMNNCPDGYTLLMATAYGNNVTVAELVWQSILKYTETTPEKQLSAVTPYGKTALHIAAEKGHTEMVDFLKAKQDQIFGPLSPAPVDLTGRTPLGAMLTSPAARKNKSALSKALFSDQDQSILGSPAPAVNRCGSVGMESNTDVQQLVYGHSDMPGRRINMEDAMATTCWTSQHNTPVAFFGVFDGHGDGGKVSRFVAEQLPETMSKQKMEPHQEPEWQPWCAQACLLVDQRLQLKNLPGGSTAVAALVTPTDIVVANIGDSRCILIQKNSSAEDISTPKVLADDTTGLEQGIKELSVADEKAPLQSPQSHHQEKMVTETSTTASLLPSEELSWKHHVVTALSQDHKPCLETEKVRVENAGLSVLLEEFQDENGQNHVISKVKLSDADRMGVSRSFGDFEYKKSKELPADEQAVIAVPEVTVHRRDQAKDCFLVLACDGVWDVMSNEEVGKFVVNKFAEKLHNCRSGAEESAILPSIGDSLLAECFQRGSADNMSITVVGLSATAEKLSTSQGCLRGRALNFAE